MFVCLCVHGGVGFLESGDLEKGSRRTKAFLTLCFLTDIQRVLHVKEEVRSKDE